MSRFLSLTAAFCLLLFFSCTHIDPPPQQQDDSSSSSANESMKYCVYKDVQQCIPTSLAKCPADGELSDFCPPFSLPSSSSIASSSSSSVPSSASVVPSSSSIASGSSSSVPSSSSVVPSSSSLVGNAAVSSSSGGGWSSSSVPDQGMLGAKKGITTRYWDGCKPSCSYIGNIGNPDPWVIGRACDKNGNNEIPLLYLNPRSDAFGTYYTPVPSSWDLQGNWLQSQTYKDWVNTHPEFTKGSSAYTCFDMAPYAVNDTLAYAFVATSESTLPCGKCARLQFNTTPRALKGKTLIVMANNTGSVGENHFDIMIPGGGVGAYNCFSEQIGSSASSLGNTMGGLLSECIFSSSADVQKCLSDKCHIAFDGKSKNLLDGCLWHAEWLMAADSPNVDWVKTPCPKYLVDKYNSTATTKLPDCYISGTCQIDGLLN